MLIKHHIMKTFNLRSIILVLLSVWLPVQLSAQGLRISRGANVVVSGDAKIVLQDAGIISQGSFTPGSSTVVFTGDAATGNAIIAGNSSTSFHNIRVDLPAGQLQLQSNIALDGNLQLVNGNLELNRYNLNLGRSGSILGENMNARITGAKGGTITTTVVLNAPQNVQPGNIGIVLSSAANFGTTEIMRGHLPQMNASGQTGIQRYFEIRPAYNSNAMMDVRFIYLEPELGNNKEADLVLWSDAGNGKGWSAQTTALNDANANWVTGKPGAAGRFTLGPGNNNSLVKFKGNAAVKRSGLHSVQTYPNPAVERFTLSVTSNRSLQGNILLQDEYGRILERRPVNYRAGINTMDWNMGRYTGGTYYLVFENMDVESVKIVKQ